MSESELYGLGCIVLPLSLVVGAGVAWSALSRKEEERQVRGESPLTSLDKAVFFQPPFLGGCCLIYVPLTVIGLVLLGIAKRLSF